MGRSMRLSAGEKATAYTTCSAQRAGPRAASVARVITTNLSPYMALVETSVSTA